MNFSFHSAFKRFLQFVCLGTLALMSSVAYAQSGGTFVSGSTGADGAFSPAAGAPGTTTTVTLSARTYHFTTITIPSGVTVQFTRSPGNPPVILLATGDVRIEGRITVAGGNGGANGEGLSTGVGGPGGPGGFNGGNGALGAQTTRGGAGEGPGGGAGGFSLIATVGSWAGAGGGYATSGSAPAASGLSASRTYGTPALQPVIGGSGGGGGGLPVPPGSAPAAVETGGPGGLPYQPQLATGGGGGGGAIVIASSGSILLGGVQREIDASGGSGRLGSNSQHGQGGGGGAGGGVRLIANTIARSVTGNNSIIRVNGGVSIAPIGGYATGQGGVGFIRFDAFTVSGTFFTAPSNLPISFGRPMPILPENAPQLRIASIGGVATPANPAASFQFAPDVTLPTAQVNPVTITVAGSGIPVGTVVNLLISSENGAQTRIAMPALSGSDANSTTSVQATLPNGMSVIYASATVGLIGAQPTAVNGDVIEKKEYLAGLGGATQVRYVGRSGRFYTEGEFSAAAPGSKSER